MRPSSAFLDAYEVLGVGPKAAQAEVKAAHRRLIRRHHPDLAPPAERAAATRRAQEINLAYGLVRDPAARVRYDRLRSAELARRRVAKGAANAGAGVAMARDHARAAREQVAREWDALVGAAGRWAWAWWRRHRGPLRRAALRTRRVGADSVGRVLWLATTVGWALLGLLIVTAAGRFVDAEGPFAALGGVLGGGLVGSRRGWRRRLRLAGLPELLPAARRSERWGYAIALTAALAGFGADTLLLR